MLVDQGVLEKIPYEWKTFRARRVRQTSCSSPPCYQVFSVRYESENNEGDKCGRIHDGNMDVRRAGRSQASVLCLIESD